MRRLEQARDAIPLGTRVNVTFLEHEDLRMRLDAARTARRLGFVPGPHISARRLRSAVMLAEFLASLQAEGAADNVFVVGRGPGHPARPVPGRPGRDPVRAAARVRRPARKPQRLPGGAPGDRGRGALVGAGGQGRGPADQGLPGSIITQFGFDVDPVLTWIETVRCTDVTVL